MVRAPCCDMMGLKKGPWTPEEDKLLVSYIQEHGHGNWRALPKQAGLLRCGKSCRLRWTNYLRPDIKRGNFTTDEEDAIIALHHQLGNKWSAIAARLPGRTDNEIKNVWHTHLKKRLAGDGCEAGDQHQPPKQRRRSLTLPRDQQQQQQQQQHQHQHQHQHQQQQQQQRKFEPAAVTTPMVMTATTLSNESSSTSSWGERVSSCSVAAASANNHDDGEIPELDDRFWSEELTSIDSSSASASSRTADTGFMDQFDFERAIFSSAFSEDNGEAAGGSYIFIGKTNSFY